MFHSINPKEWLHTTQQLSLFEFFVWIMAFVCTDIMYVRSDSLQQQHPHDWVFTTPPPCPQVSQQISKEKECAINVTLSKEQEALYDK